MAYRPSLHGPKGNWGRFLDQARKDRDWSAVQAWENLHGLLGLSPKSVAVYKAIESGTRAVSADEAEALRDYFGAGPETRPEPVEPMVAALTAQTEAIVALVGELRSARMQEGERNAEIDAMMRRLAERALVGPETEDTEAPDAHPEIAE
jgi:hypothetical protein